MDEAVINHLLSGGRMAVKVPIGWTSAPGFVTAKVAVDAPEMYGAGLVLDLSLSRVRPWRYTYQLRSGGVQIRRLDVRGSHRNHVGEPGVWRDETHKHRWTDLYGDAIAYSPDDIPAKPGTTVGADEYRAVFEAFAAECRITLTGGYRWVEPDLESSSGGGA